MKKWQAEARIRMAPRFRLPYQTENFVMYCKTEM